MERCTRSDGLGRILLVTLLYIAILFLASLLPVWLFPGRAESFYPAATLWIKLPALFVFFRSLLTRRPVWLGASERLTVQGVALTALLASGIFVITTFAIGPFWMSLFTESAARYEGALEASMRYPAVSFVELCVLAPVAEELLFRGYALPNIRARHGARTALLLSTALFAAVHFNLYQMASVALTGAALGILYQRTGTVRYTILLHFFLNFIAFSLLRALSA